MNISVEKLQTPLMSVVVMVGVMVGLSMLLPMLPSMPLVDQLKAEAEHNKDNLQNAILMYAVVVYVGVFVKNMLKL